MTGAVAVQKGWVHLKKERKALSPQVTAHSHRSSRVRDTYAAQANPVLATLRHVLRVIILRAVMPVFCALATNQTSGRCILVAGKPLVT